jgi:ribosome recycling factor
MSPDQVISQVKAKFAASTQRLEEELKKLRTGRANSSMLDGISVEAYGQPMPLNQVATISVPEAQLLQITPFDPNNLQAIAAAIRDDQSLGLNPMDDGRVVRVAIPALTTERRQQIAKQLGDKVEDCMISLRNIRHDAMKELDQAKKDKEIGEDEHKRFSAQIDQLMAGQKAQAEAASKAKEQEILTL